MENHGNLFAFNASWGGMIPSLFLYFLLSTIQKLYSPDLEYPLLFHGLIIVIQIEKHAFGYAEQTSPPPLVMI
jgi:hypothetical protein